MNLIFSESEKNFIKKNYGKIPYREMAKQMNRNWMDIRHCATKMGVTNKGNVKRNFSGRKASKVNEDFFNTPNELNSYWAGFLAADATIQDSSKNHKRLTLKLSEKDANHIEKFKKDLSYQGKIYSCIEKIKYKGEIRFYPSRVIKISNKKIVNDLISKFKITERKTFTLEFPELESDSLIDFFIIGYIDGDGCIREREKQYEIVILGNKGFLNKVSERLSKICQEDVPVTLKQKGAKIHKIAVYGKKAKKIFLHFYPLSLQVGALKRKWEKGLS